MSDWEVQERAKVLSRLWQGSIVPVEEPESTATRRERVTGALVSKIAKVGERRLARQRHRRRAGILLAAAAVLVTIGSVWRLSQSNGPDGAVIAVQAPVGSIRGLSGIADIVRGSQKMVVSTDTALQTGDSIRTAANGEAEIRLGRLVRARLRPDGTVAVLKGGTAEHRFALSRGRIELDVDDRPATRPKLSVETPDAEVVVTGTIFDVEVTDGSAPAATVTSVAVTRGHVHIFQKRVLVASLSAGQRWRSAEIAAVQPKDEPPAAKAVELPPAGPKAAANTDPGTLAVENQLFQSALEARKRGNDGSAVAELGAMLSKYPGSPLAHEARVERMRAYHRMGLAREAAREAGRYLADYPEGAARDEAKRFVMEEAPAE